MKESRFTEKRSAFALKQANAGTRLKDVCPELGVNPASFFRREKYGGPGITELRRPDKRVDKTFIESYNGRFREEHVNRRWFV
jgi:Transposase